MISTKRGHESPDSEAESESSKDDIYEVERILAQEDADGEVLYLVKWKGYDDRECSWEPADSFQDRTTIVEWERQFSKGDALDEDQVSQLQQIMDEFKAVQEEGQTHKEEVRLAREAKRQKLLVNPNPPSESKSPVRKSSPSKPQPQARSTATQQPTAHAKSSLLQPTFVSRYDLTSAAFPSPTLPKTTAVSASISAGLPQSAKPRRSSIAKGTKFRNLSHMNNSQKKASRADIAPQMTNLIAPSEISRREPAHILPSTPGAARQDSLLFFESWPDSAEPLAQSPVHQVSSNANPRNADWLEARQSGTGEAAVDTNRVAPGHSLMSTKSGRQWTFEEVLVQLSLGDHRIGDVKLAGLPPWLRRLLLDLKIGSELRLHFQQDFVLNRQEFGSLTATWPLSERAYGEVQPFEDTYEACDSLATYFEQHDVGAIYSHPDPVSSIALILHSSSQPRWRKANYTPLTGKMPRLLLGVRNRALKDQIPPPMMPPQLRPLSRPMGISLLPEILAEQPKQPLDEENLPTPAQNMTLAEFGVDSPALAQPLAMEDGDTAPSKVIEDQPPKPDLASKETDWICDLNHRLMVSTTSARPFVYIAFGDSSSDQAEAVQLWAEKFTSKRLIFVEKEGLDEWREFCDTCGSNSPALIIFGDETAFCKLKSLGMLLGKFDGLSCFRLSWRPPGAQTSPRYVQTRIFSRGTVLLLTEATLSQPALSQEILAWFEKHSKSKSKSWRLMLRPNVRAWLQHKALQGEDNDIGRHYLDVLVQLHKLSSVIDVTAVGNGLDRLRSLESMVSSRTEKSEDFIIPMPLLTNYDSSPSAGHSTAAQRDEILLRHFVGWSALNVFNHRRFMVIDGQGARQGRDETIYDNAHHIVFRTPEQFGREIVDKKNGSSKKQGWGRHCWNSTIPEEGQHGGLRSWLGFSTLAFIMATARRTMCTHMIPL